MMSMYWRSPFAIATGRESSIPLITPTASPKSEYMWRALTLLASPSGRSSVSAELQTRP